MRIEETRDGDLLVLRPRVPQLTAAVAPELKAHLGRVVEDGHARLVLHLGDVEFVDSTALGALVSVVKRLGGSGELALCAASETVRAMLEVTRMDRVLRVFGDEADAREALRPAVS